METWTEQRTAMMREMWTAGYSARSIAEKTNELAGFDLLTRSAVIGKANRLGLSKQTKSSKTRKQNKAKRSALPSAPDPTPGVDLVDLQRHHCRFPLEARPPFTYCGNNRQDGSSYCEFHHAMCRVKTEKAPRTEPSFRPFTAAYR